MMTKVTSANRASCVVESPLVGDPSSSELDRLRRLKLSISAPWASILGWSPGASMMVSLGWSRCQATPAQTQMTAKTRIPHVTAKIGNFFVVELIVWELIKLIHTSSTHHRHIRILNLLDKHKMLVAICNELGSGWQSVPFSHNQIPFPCGEVSPVQVESWSNQFNPWHQMTKWGRNKKVESHAFFASVCDHQVKVIYFFAFVFHPTPPTHTIEVLYHYLICANPCSMNLLNELAQWIICA